MFFPFLDGTRNYRELRMRPGYATANPLIPLSIARPHFAQQMGPLILELPLRRGQGAAASGRDLRGIESIPPAGGFLIHHQQEVRNCPDGVLSRAESLKLRMMAVSPCLSAEDLLRQQPFPPERHQPARIKQTRVKSPEPQVTGFGRAQTGRRF